MKRFFSPRTKTEKLWNKHFQGKVPYHVEQVIAAGGGGGGGTDEKGSANNSSGASGEKEEGQASSKIKFNIVAAALRQGSFYYQV